MMSSLGKMLLVGFVLFSQVDLWANSAVKSALMVQSSKPWLKGKESLLKQFPGLKIAVLFPGAKDPRIANYYSLEFLERDYKSIRKELQKRKERKELLEVEDVYNIASYSIEPKPEKLKSQGIAAYQWYLDSGGQKKISRYSDEYLETEEVAEGAGVPYQRIQDLVVPKMEKEVLVAVVDSGVDIDHPSLKSSIYTHKEECFQKARKPTEKDPFPNDCHGWNTTAANITMQSQVYDYYGHGTHIAGIIAAQGKASWDSTKGISSKIKILPVKVYSTPTEPQTSYVPDPYVSSIYLSMNVLKALYYSIYRKADVINLSLGWPPFAESKSAKGLLEIASEKNILVVAAAGNDASFSQVFPCAYESVVCVGASGIQGTSAYFTNYGGHVDFQAPGETILSTVPMSLVQPIHFVGSGFDYKSGSSQAAPIISAYAAILKSIFPQDKNLDTYRRLFSSASPSKEGFSLRSLPDLVKASSNEGKDRESLQPSFKETARFQLVGDKIRARIKVRNYSPVPRTFSLYASLSSHRASMEKCQGEVAAYDSTPCELLWSLDKEESISSLADLVDLKVEFSEEGKAVRNYFHKLHLRREFRVDRRISLPDLKGRESKSDFQVIDFPSLRTVEDMGFEDEAVHYYYNLKNKVRILKVTEESESYIDLELRPEEELSSILLKDFNGDGASDYLIIKVKKEPTAGKDFKLRVFYQFLQQDGNSLFEGQNTGFEIENSNIGLNDINKGSLAWAWIENSELGRFLSPILWGNRDSVKDSSQRLVDLKSTSNRNAVYALYPKREKGGVYVLTPKLVDSQSFYRDYLRDYSVDKAAGVLHILPQSKIQQSQNQFSLLVASGKGALESYEIVDFTLNKDQPVALRRRELKTNLNPILGVPSSPMIHSETWDYNFGLNYYQVEYYRSKLVALKDLNSHAYLKSFAMNQSYEADKITSLLFSYLWQNKSLHFMVSPTKLYLFEENGDELRSVGERSIVTSTIVPFQKLTQKFLPFLYRIDGVNYPAVLVDDTQMESAHFQIYYYDGKTLNTSASLKLNVPDKCRVKSPMPIGKEKLLNGVLLCEQEDGSFELWWERL